MYVLVLFSGNMPEFKAIQTYKYNLTLLQAFWFTMKKFNANNYALFSL